MTAVFYEAMFLSSLVLTGLYMLIWHKHFDPRLAPCYAAARPRLEQYYAGLEGQGNDHRSV